MAGRSTFAQPRPAVAPVHAVEQPALAVPLDGVTLTRVTRPKGAVDIQADETLTVVVRINRLARALRTGSPNGSCLEQCFAPDFILMVGPGGQCTLAAHADQDLLVVRATITAIERLTGQPFRMPGHLEQPLADRFLTDLVERVFSGDAALAEALLRPLFMEVAMASTTTRRLPVKGGLSLRQLSRLRDHVETRLSQPLPNTELAQLVQLSPFHFSRAFRNSMGAAPATWIRMRRLSVAQKLLADPKRSIIDVAAAVGYESPSRFATAFRGFTGLTPSAWRRAAG